MPSWAMVIDLDKCTGCGACITACKEENNIPQVPPEEAFKGRTISWMDIVTEITGDYPDVRVKYIPRPCMHCDNPPCTKVCPVHATYKSESGIIAQIYPRCIGCRYCMAACPYTVKYFNWFEPQWPESMKNVHNPDVSLRPVGVVEKCTFCSHRIQRAKEQAKAENRVLTDLDVIPACAESCPGKAIYFGDLENSNSEVSKLSKSERVFRLLEELGTEPRVYYLSEEEKYV